MKLSVFRPKGNTPTSSPRRTSRFSQILSQGRSSKSNSSQDQLPIGGAPYEGDSQMEHNLNSSDVALPPPSSPAGTESSSVARARVTALPQSPQAAITSDAIDEQEMTRKLLDVESSFLPDTTTANDAQPTERGTSSANGALLSRDPTSITGTDRLGDSRMSRDSKQLPVQPFPSPDPTRDHTTMHSDALHVSSAGPIDNSLRLSALADAGKDDAVKSVEATSSNKRTVEEILPANSTEAADRATDRSSTLVPLTSLVSDNTRVFKEDLKTSTTQSDGTAGEKKALQALPLGKETVELSISPTRGARSSGEGEETASDIGNALQNRFGKQSSDVQNFRVSQHSSSSSFASHEAQSDVTRGKEQLQHSRTTMSGSTSTMRQSYELSRLPSLGSLASSLSDDAERRTTLEQRRLHGMNPAPAAKPSLERVDEHTPVKPRRSSYDDQTPRAPSHSLPEPSETVLAKHVKDIQVPDTVAKEFRTANRLSLFNPSPLKSVLATPSLGRGKINLTLKEQNSRIDKLTKENFDLKLKIHYLYQALQDRSPEGVKDLISQSAQLQADLVKSKKEVQSLRKRIKELETSRNRPLQPSNIEDETEDELSSRGYSHIQMEDEIIYLRNEMQRLESEKEQLERGQNNFTESNDNGNADAALYEERAIRQKCEREIRDLRIEVARLSGNPTPLRTLKHQRSFGAFGFAALGNGDEPEDGTSVSEATLVDQLRQENSGLRRDLSAQTSMLTSHTRERERLQQEIEDLKIGQRRHGLHSAGQDTIRGRPISRRQQAQQRPRMNADIFANNSSDEINDSDREYYEEFQANLRDENAHLRMQNQDLLRDLANLKDSIDILALVETERDEAAQALREADADVDYLTEAVKQLEDSIAQKEEEVSRSEMELRRREKESDIFQAEIKSIGDSLNRLVEDSESSQVTIQNLQQDLINANGELESMENSLRDALTGRERLEVQAESSKSMIAFLREEQESDKIKIGDLESALKTARIDLKSNQGRAEVFEELENGMSMARDESRRLRKALAEKELEASNSHSKLKELESGLKRAFGDFDGSGAKLLKEIRKLQLELENTSEELDGARDNLAAMDKKVKDREALLESSGLETKRLSDLLDREKQARKHDQNEYDRARRRNASSKADERIIDLEDELRRGQKKLANLEQQFRSQMSERSVLLLTLWTRLSTLCGPEWKVKWRLVDADGNALTLETLPQYTTLFNQAIFSAVQHLETAVSGFEVDLRNKTECIWEDMRVLEHNLSSRLKRLDKVEKALAHHRNGAGAELAVALKDLSRAKDENRRLRKEVKFLKQGSFALPGLPSPKQRDGGSRDDYRSERASSHRGGSSAKASVENIVRSASASGFSPSAHKHQYHTAISHGSSSKQYLRTAPQTASLLPPPFSTGGDESTTGGSVSSRQDDSDNNQETVVHHAQPPETSLIAPRHNNRKVSSSGSASDAVNQSQRLPHSLSQREQTWILRLEELKRALNSEREARLLDREGARQRLEIGQQETQDLKAALFRERAKKAKEVVPSAGNHETAFTGNGLPSTKMTAPIAVPTNDNDVD